MAELLVSITLDALQKVGHEGGLLLQDELLLSLILLIVTLDLRQLLELFKLVC